MAVLSRDHPGMGVADGVLGQLSVGGAELLSDLSVGLSTDSACLSLHPVGQLDL